MAANDISCYYFRGTKKRFEPIQINQSSIVFHLACRGFVEAGRRADLSAYVDAVCD